MPLIGNSYRERIHGNSCPTPRGSKKAYHWLINHDELRTCPQRLANLLLTTITRLC